MPDGLKFGVAAAAAGQAAALRRAAAGLAKAAGEAEVSYAMRGRLYLSKSGWILVDVPNALVRGVFDTIHEPGVELPANGEGRLTGHISAFRPEELAKIGGPDRVSERGHMVSYTTGPLRCVEPDGWSEMSRVWFVEVKSPELEKIRKSYGLSARPNDDKFQFHITCGVRRKKVTRPGDVKKADAPDRLPGGEADGEPDSAFPPEALAEGARHEREHTTDPALAREIAKDHLRGEGADYYEKLEAMEEGGEKAAGRAAAAPGEPSSEIRGGSTDGKRAAVTYVPRAVLDAVRAEGLLSGERIAGRPELLERLAAARKADDPAAFAAEFKRTVADKVKGGWDSPRGPNVLFKPPPASTTLPDNHPLRQWDLVPVRVKLERLLRDVPGTRVHGQELTPYSKEEDEKDPEYHKRRHHDLDVKELRRLSRASAARLWATYADPDGKGMYAPNVPHAAVVTPDGRIDPKYLAFPKGAAADPLAEYLGDHDPGEFDMAAVKRAAAGPGERLDAAVDRLVRSNPLAATGAGRWLSDVWSHGLSADPDEPGGHVGRALRRAAAGKPYLLRSLIDVSGDAVGTGHKRLALPAGRLSEGGLRSLGFVPSVLAVPERGQTSWLSFRHPRNRFHLHPHGGHWTVHEDRHPSMTMALSGAGTLGDKARAVAAGTNHVVTEGVPGAAYYLSGLVTRPEGDMIGALRDAGGGRAVLGPPGPAKAAAATPGRPAGVNPAVVALADDAVLLGMLLRRSARRRLAALAAAGPAVVKDAATGPVLNSIVRSLAAAPLPPPSPPPGGSDLSAIVSRLMRRAALPKTPTPTHLNRPVQEFRARPARAEMPTLVTPPVGTLSPAEEELRRRFPLTWERLVTLNKTAGLPALIKRSSGWSSSSPSSGDEGGNRRHGFWKSLGWLLGGGVGTTVATGVPIGSLHRAAFPSIPADTPLSADTQRVLSHARDLGVHTADPVEAGKMMVRHVIKKYRLSPGALERADAEQSQARNFRRGTAAYIPTPLPDANSLTRPVILVHPNYPAAGTYAHELGHHLGPKWLTSSQVISKFGLPLSTAAALLSSDERTSRIAAMAGTASALPMLASELDASRRGASLLKQLKIGRPKLSQPLARWRASPYAGLPTYVVGSTAPLVAHYGKKLLGGFRPAEKQSAAAGFLPKLVKQAVSVEKTGKAAVHHQAAAVAVSRRGAGRVLVCPHCGKEIKAGSLYTDKKGWTFHRPCFLKGKGSIRLPATTKTSDSHALEKLAGLPPGRFVRLLAKGPSNLASRISAGWRHLTGRNMMTAARVHAGRPVPLPVEELAAREEEARLLAAQQRSTRRLGGMNLTEGFHVQDRLLGGSGGFVAGLAADEQVGNHDENDKIRNYGRRLMAGLGGAYLGGKGLNSSVNVLRRYISNTSPLFGYNPKDNPKFTLRRFWRHGVRDIPMSGQENFSRLGATPVAADARYELLRRYLGVHKENKLADFFVRSSDGALAFNPEVVKPGHPLHDYLQQHAGYDGGFRVKIRRIKLPGGETVIRPTSASLSASPAYSSKAEKNPYQALFGSHDTRHVPGTVAIKPDGSASSDHLVTDSWNFAVDPHERENARRYLGGLLRSSPRAWRSYLAQPATEYKDVTVPVGGVLGTLGMRQATETLLRQTTPVVRTRLRAHYQMPERMFAPKGEVAPHQVEIIPSAGPSDVSRGWLNRRLLRGLSLGSLATAVGLGYADFQGGMKGGPAALDWLDWTQLGGGVKRAHLGPAGARP